MATRISRKVEADQKHTDYRAIGVAPLNPVIGAEIEGVDLSRELTPEQLAEIRRASLDHHVLVFRDQKLTGEDHKRFARHVRSAARPSLSRRGHDAGACGADGRSRRPIPKSSS